MNKILVFLYCSFFSITTVAATLMAMAVFLAFFRLEDPEFGMKLLRVWAVPGAIGSVLAFVACEWKKRKDGFYF